MTPATEHEEQCAFVQWLEWNYPNEPWFAIPNGGKRDVRVAMKLKKEGVKPGVPDIFFAYPNKRYNGLFIEMKAQKNRYVTDAQEEMMFKLIASGFKCVVAKGVDQAISAVKEYMG